MSANTTTVILTTPEGSRACIVGAAGNLTTPCSGGAYGHQESIDYWFSELPFSSYEVAFTEAERLEQEQGSEHGIRVIELDSDMLVVKDQVLE